MPTPPPPAPGAEVDTFTITNAEVPGDGKVKVTVENFANKDNANDVTIVNTSTDPITELTVEKFGDNDGEEDVIRIDLTEFDEDFTLFLKNTGNTVSDQLFLIGLDTYVDNEDGTFTVTYTGTDAATHTVTVDVEEPATTEVTPYYAPDGIVDGDEGAEVMGAGYLDRGDDAIDGADGDNDSILGNGGSDTISGGAGDDTIAGDIFDIIGRLAPSMPEKTFTGTHPGPAAGAEVDSFTITNANINSGVVTVEVDQFATKENANDVTIVHGGTEDITRIDVKKFGDGDDEADVIRFDLSTYDDDFDVIIANEDTYDTIVFEGVHTVTDNGDGTWDATYYGTDSVLHSVMVDPDTANVAFYVTTSSPYYYNDEIDGGAGDDEIDGGYGDDSITGGIGADTILGNIGQDTIDGGTGADAIYGDWDQALTSETAPGPSGGAEIDTFTITNADVPGNGEVDIDLNQFAEKNNANDVTVTNTSTTPITLVEIRNLGGNEGQQDVVRFDLSEFNESFDIVLSNTGDTVTDLLYLEGVNTATDNGDGTWSVDFYGSDDLLHTATVTPENAQLEVFYAPAPEQLLSVEADDSITGGAGDDTIDGGLGDDTIDAGADDDSVLGGDGDDDIDAGTGADYVDGGVGHDTIFGDDGADTLYGGDSVESVPLERVALNWSDVPDPDDGGQIDHLDALTTGSQTVGGTTVSFTMTNGGGQFETTTTYTGGIDAGTGSVDGNSAFGFDNAGGTLTLDFTTPVENVQFNVNDFEEDLETLTVQAYDAQNNLIPFSVVQGANITGTDTDTISGNDSFESPSGEVGDASALASVGITIPGPVSSIVLTYTETGGSLTMTDVWFDDPATGIIGGGDDSIDAGAGDDVIHAGQGTDTIIGGTGTDTYDANTSSDLTDETITVTVDGNGNGTVAKLLDATTDSITGIESFIAGEDDNEDDEITLTAPVTAFDVSGMDNSAVGFFTSDETGQSYFFGGAGEPTINDILTRNFDPGTGVLRPQGTYTITGGEENGAQIGTFYVENFENINFDVVCFARGTHVETDRGEVRIEDLKAGDLVRTLDNGLQPIRWIGSTTTAALGKNAPVEIRKGALGNTRDLRVSPQHRMLLTGWQLELLFGDGEALVPAKSLINDHSIRRVPGGIVEYFHMLFDTHQIVFAEGAPSESFHPGAVGMATFTETTLGEIHGLFPALRDDVDAYGPSARASLKRFEAKVLCEMGGVIH